MKPQKQKICSENNGDCFRACVASMLELPNDDNLPNPHGDAWLTEWLKWFGGIGLRLSWHHKSIWRDGFWIASVQSKNFENTTHAIIMRGLHVFFDPSLGEKYSKGAYMLKSELVSGGWWIEIDDMRKFKDFMEKQRPPIIKSTYGKTEKITAISLAGGVKIRVVRDEHSAWLEVCDTPNVVLDKKASTA